MTSSGDGVSVPVPVHLAADWLVWRPIREKMLTWADANSINGITLHEVWLLNDLLDLDVDLQRAQAKAAKRSTNGHGR